MAHRAVIFAIAQLSCLKTVCPDNNSKMSSEMRSVPRPEITPFDQVSALCESEKFTDLSANVTSAQ